MNARLDCIPCLIRQGLEAARLSTDDPSVQERILRGVLRETLAMDFAQCPPAVGQRIHRQLRLLSGSADPYRAVKDRFNAMALHMAPELAVEIESAGDPLLHAVRLAIAGNMMDLGVKGGIGEGEARFAIRSARNDLFHGDIEAFRAAVLAARRILYLADNAGEIVLDRLLVERLPHGRVTVAVRGAPVLNDATRADAVAAGIDRVAEIIDNGSDAPGTILEDCDTSFRRRFAKADLVIAKGQGNFETLSEAPAPIYFLFKIKCPVTAAHTGFPVGTHMLMRSHAFRDAAEEAAPVQETPRGERGGHA
jgi:hypothetical protein